MKHKVFYTFEEFFEYFKLSPKCSIRLTSDEFAHFPFKPYKSDYVTFHGYIKEFNHQNVQVSFKYKEFSLGSTTWSLEDAKKYIGRIDYYYED